MQHIPRDLLRRILALPEGKPLRLVVNTNGHGEWKTEVILFEGPCGENDQVDVLSLLLQREDTHSMTIDPSLGYGQKAGEKTSL